MTGSTVNSEFDGDFWVCERHPLEVFEHDPLCNGPGMPLEAFRNALRAMYRLSEDGGAFYISKEENSPFKVTLVAYGVKVGFDRLPEDQWLHYEHPTLLGAIVAAVRDVWPEASRGQ